jgi:hypothetical protein
VIPYNTLTVHCARFNVKINEQNGGHSYGGILYHVVLRSCDNIYGTNKYISELDWLNITLSEGVRIKI